MRAMDRLLEVMELLAWIAAESTDERVVARVRAKLEEIDLRVCPACDQLYLHITGSRHYRCSNCRWKRQLIREAAAQ